MISFMDIDIPRGKLLKSIESVRMAILNEIKGDIEIPQAFRNRGAISLKEELEGTKNLSNWPCRSFKDLNGLVHTSAQLAANCSDPRVRCSVPFDVNGG
jgi:hypothetical protein